MRALLRKIRQILRDRRTRRIFTRLVSTVAAIVVFVTTYALVLPAITMESEAACGIEAHQHDQGCYTDVLVCEIPESSGHVHDESCYSTKQKQVCQIEEHVHDSDCYDENGELICGKTEHQHGEDCFEEVRELECEIPESPGHEHDDSCYQKVLTCGKEAHTHSAACYHVDTASQAATEAIAVASTESTGAAAAENAVVDADSLNAPAQNNESENGLDSPPENSVVEGGLNASPDNSLSEKGTTALTDEVSADEPGVWTSKEAAADATAATAASTGPGAGVTGSTGSSTGGTAATAAPAGATDTMSAEAGYVPVLDELNFNNLLNKHTGIYYSRLADADSSADNETDGADAAANTGGTQEEAAAANTGGTQEEAAAANTGETQAKESDPETNSGEKQEETIAENTGEAHEAATWNRIDKYTELKESDNLRLYLAYTIPAGSLNETNQTARYRLPGNIHLTDEQIESINTTVNGIAGQYVSYDTLEILDQEMYGKYLGIEAVEGTRTPSDDLNEYLANNGGQEFISATVKVENTYDENTGVLKAQDLVFTFAPYTIQKNRHQYDPEGKPTKAGEEVNGWLTIDVSTKQIDWEKADDGTQSVDIIFVEKDKKSGIKEIITELKLVETGRDSDSHSGNADGANAAAADTRQDDAKDSQAEDGTSDNTEKEPVSYPSVSFDDSITVSGGSLSTDTDVAPGDAGMTAETEITVHVEADKDTFPEGTTMVLSAVSDEQMSTVAEAVEGAVDAPKTMGFHAVDISFRDAEGNEIEPLKPIRVSMTSDAIKRAVEDATTAPVVVHVSDPAADKAAADGNTDARGSTEPMDEDEAEGADDQHILEPSESTEEQASGSDQETTPKANIIETDTETKEKHGDTLTFDAETFSVYAIVYTVDFHYEVNGKMYDFSIPGGGFVSLEHLVEALGIGDSDKNSENREASEDDQSLNYTSTTYEDSIRLNRKIVSEDTKKFVADVDKVEFSNPDLVWIGKVDKTATLGELKKANGLEVECSADLTKDQISEINVQTVEAGDWTLISMQPFSSEENLTITMKNGDQFVVKVTDAQISTHVITADGKDYVITVTYGPEAGIPEGSALGAVEISKDSTSYEQYVKETEEVLSKLNGADAKVQFARYFDITIYDAEGNEIEPKEDVSVSIKYANTVDLKSGEASIVHFADKGTEVLKVDTRRDVEGGKESVNVFDFKQGSFSVSGTVVTADSISTAQYFIVAESEGQYYALKNDGSAVPVTYNSNLGIYTIENDSDAQACLWNVMHTYGDRYVISQDDGKCLFINGYNIFGSMDPEIIADPQGGGTFSLLHAGGWDTYTTLTFDNNTFGTADYYEQYGWVTRYGWFNIPYRSWEKTGDNAANIHFAKYSIETSGTVPDPQSFPGSDVDPDDVADWLGDLYDDAMIDASGCTKTAEVFDYENRIYQIDMTAKSSARALVRNIDLAFSFDFSNSMLFPANLTPMGTIELSHRELEGLANANRISRDKVYFVISDVDATATVTAVFYKGGKWYQQDASKFARAQAKNSGSDCKLINDNNGIPTKIRDVDTGYYTLYSAPQGYVDYILRSDKPIVYENTYNRLTVMKNSVVSTFNVLDELAAKYKVKVRVGWNGFAGYVDRDESGEKYDFGAEHHPLVDLESFDVQTMIEGFNEVGSTDGPTTGGGTRPDKAFDDAYSNMGFNYNDTTTDKYLFLITDGAPQGGGASSTTDAYNKAVTSAGKLSGKGVRIASIGLGTNRVLNAHNLFATISYTPDGRQQMEYQATDGAKLRNAMYYAIMQALTDLTVIGDVTDTIDSAFYPVSTDGTPLQPGDWIDLSGVRMTNHSSSTAHGVIGKDDNGDWTVIWENQNITWPNENYPEGWHGKVHIKSKEDFLGGNTIPTNEHASIEAKKLKDPKTNAIYNFDDLYNPADDSLSTNPVEPESPYVNVDELYIPPQTTEWTVYRGTKVDSLTQMKEMYKNTNVYEVVKQESQDHRMVSPSDMVYTLTNGNTDFVKMNAVADNRQVNGERNPVPLSYYLINCTEEAEDLTDEEWQILISGGKVSRRYLEYDHEPGTIELTLTTEGGSYDIHEANTVGTGVEKYFLNVLYKPDAAEDINYHTGSYRTLQSGLAAGNISRQLKHIINVIKRIITVKKTKSDNTDLDGATFKIYQKDDSDNEINVVTLTGGTAVWDYVLPDEDQKVPGDYWKDSTTWYLKEESAPEGYAKYDEEIEFQIDISDTKTDLPPANNNNAALYTWVQAASLSIVSTIDSDYVSVIGDSDITISVKNDKSIDIVVIKTDINGDLIPGAQFTLTKGSELVTYIKVIKKDGSWENESDRIVVENGVFTIPAGGVTILGLAAGEYTLTETKAPDGYIKTIQPVKFTAGRDGTVTYTNAADNPAPKVLSVNENKQYTIQNEPGASLPSTGGFGTTMIYILGSILTFGAGVLLWRRRRLI